MMIKLVLSLVSAMLVNAGCTTVHPPASSLEAVQAMKSEAKAPVGYLAITAGLESTTLAGEAAMELELVETGADEHLILRIVPGDLVSADPKKPLTPVIFVLPAGRYEVIDARLVSPQVVMTGGKYGEMPFAIDLSLAKGFAFDLKPDQWRHFATVEGQLVQTQWAPGKIRNNAQTKIQFGTPDQKLWDPYRSLTVQGLYLFDKAGKLIWLPFPR